MKKAYVKPELCKRGVLSNVTALITDSNGIPLPSDIRLKTGVEKVGVSDNGLAIYTFKYIGGDAVYRGVMAQDVLELYPDAVSVMPNGYMAVRYDMLGMKMTRVH